MKVQVPVLVEFQIEYEWLPLRTYIRNTLQQVGYPGVLAYVHGMH